MQSDSYDIPGALNVQLRDHLGHEYDQWQFEMNALYTAYSFPNLFMPVIGGVLVDRLGPTRMLMLFSVLVCFGMSLFAIGVSSHLYWMMAVGRVLFGIGGESLEVAQAIITTLWFRHKYLGLALGLNLTVARLGTALNDLISPALSNASGPVTASWFGTLTCVFSLVCGVFLVMLNRPAIRIKHGVATRQDLREQTLNEMANDETRKPLLYNGDYNDDSDEETFGSTNTRVASVVDEAGSTNDDNEHQEGIRISDIKQLPATFWVLCLAIVTLYGAVNPFIHIISDMLQEKWGVDPQYAGVLMSVPDMISAFGSPVCGYLMDHWSNKYKNTSRAMFLVLSGSLLVVVHVLLGMTQLNPIYALILLGISYSCFGGSLWPMVPHLVNNQAFLGTAYGVSTVALNLALSFVPLSVAKILSVSSYYFVSWFFILMSLVGTLLSLVIVFLDRAEYTKMDEISESSSVNGDDDSQDSEMDVELVGDHHIVILKHPHRHAGHH